jgi:hypothetical protein
MPKGKHLQNEMSSEVVHGLYYAVMSAEIIDYEKLAACYGSKNKTAAQVLQRPDSEQSSLTSSLSRNRLNAILKAQEKGQYVFDTPAGVATPATPKKTTKRKLPPINNPEAKKIKAEAATDEATANSVPGDELSGGETVVDEVEDPEAKSAKDDATKNPPALEPLIRIAWEALERTDETV